MRWSNYRSQLNVAHIFVPVVLALLSWSLPSFSPRQIIDSHDLFPFLVAPWAPPNTLSAYLSRFLQAAILWYLPSLSIDWCYSLWIYVALARTLTGYFFTRSVGWAFPPLFRHYSVYETTSGFGPALAAYFFMTGTDELVEKLNVVSKGYVRVVSPVITIFLCWLEAAPWTYGTTCIFIGGTHIVCNLVYRFSKRGILPLPITLDRGAHQPPSRAVFMINFVVFAAIFLPYHILAWFGSPSLTQMPLSPVPPTPLLDILILTFPRPDIDTSTKVLTSTINSYVPFANNEQVTLSVYTHSAEHWAFKQNKELFATQNVTFQEDGGTHPDHNSGHYLHLAEAFKWETERASQGEWLMLIEDDFPLCAQSDRAWSDISRVMNILENGRIGGQGIPERRGAFVGTGGSGLIFHKSLLPAMIHVLLTHALIKSPIPPDVIVRPPDVVMQDCLLGDDPICPRKRDGMLVITSRLVMDHIGGMVSTNPSKAKNKDKWRCGWRHPFHGRREVEVVVVN